MHVKVPMEVPFCPFLPNVSLATSFTPHKFLQTMLIDCLSNTSAKIWQSPGDCGFSSSNYLITIFGNLRLSLVSN